MKRSEKEKAAQIHGAKEHLLCSSTLHPATNCSNHLPPKVRGPLPWSLNHRYSSSNHDLSSNHPRARGLNNSRHRHPRTGPSRWRLPNGARRESLLSNIAATMSRNSIPNPAPSPPNARAPKREKREKPGKPEDCGTFFPPRPRRFA